MSPASESIRNLSEVASIIRGVTFDAGQVIRTAREGYFPVLRAGNIADQLDTTSDLLWVPADLVSDTQRLRVGDIVMCLSSGSATLVGKSAVLESPFEGTVGAFCAIIRPHERLDSDWVAWWLRSPAFTAWRDDNARGSGIQNLRVTELACMSLPFPDVEVRQRTLRSVTEALSVVRVAERACAEQLRACELLSTAELGTAFQSIVPLFAGDSPTRAPHGWLWKPLTGQARLESGHTPSRRHPEWWGGDIPWIALPDIRALDGRVAFDTSEHVNEQGIANSSARVLPTNTVVMSRTASVGYVTIMGRPMATSQDFVNWVCGPALDPRFLSYAILASRGYVRTLASGAVHKTVYMPTLKSLQICAPEIEEQRRIVRHLEDRLGLAARAARALADRRHAIASLPSAILRAAFSQSETVALRQGAVASLLVHRLHAQPTFGRVMFQKLLYLAEAHVGAELGGHYQRHAAGPYAPRELREIERLAAEEGWFSVRKEEGRYIYEPGPNIDERVRAAEALLGDRRVELDRLVAIFGPRRTEYAEVVATLFAAWNDLLMDGRDATADEIIAELHSNWHERKLRFGAERLRRALRWMRDNNIVPTGRGPRTEIVHA